jgi:hypothetical protein
MRQDTNAPFHKVIFTSSQHGATAGLVIDATKIDPRDMVRVSRLFPYSETPKMRTYHVSPAFPTFEQAFDYEFPFDMWGNAHV